MFGSVRKMRSVRWLSAISLLTVFLHLSNGIFSCCLINQNISQAIAHLFRHVNGNEKLSHGIGQNHGLDNEATCHGHHADDAESLTQFHDESAAIGKHSACISENSITHQFMLQSLPAENGATVELTAMVLDQTWNAISHRQLPRPQNKSSPPIYLLTLQILV